MFAKSDQWHPLAVLGSAITVGIGDSAVVEAQEMFSSQGGHLTNAMYHHGETL